jgi:hypothetical protein
MLFITVLMHVICADRKDADVVLLLFLLSAVCEGYIIISYFLYFVCFYVSSLFILMYAPFVVGSSTLPE